MEPDFDNITDMSVGQVYTAVRLNPPSGDDCAYIIRINQHHFAWCNENGEYHPNGLFNVADLLEE